MSTVRPVERVRGFTILELLVILAFISIVASIAAIALRPTTARAVSGEFRNVMQQARFEAVRANRPIAVVWLEDSRQLVTRSQSAVNDALICNNVGSEIVIADFGRYPALQINTDLGPNDGLVWLPSGQARTCGLAPMGDARIATIEDGRQGFDVSVSVAGLVRRTTR